MISMICYCCCILLLYTIPFVSAGFVFYIHIKYSRSLLLSALQHVLDRELRTPPLQRLWLVIALLPSDLCTHISTFLNQTETQLTM